jgi:hypothetical protein
MIASRIQANTIRVTNRVTRALHDHYTDVFYLVRREPTRGLEPRTYRLQDSLSRVTMAATSDSTVYSDLSGGHSDCGGREFVSQVVSRRHTNAVIYG